MHRNLKYSQAKMLPQAKLQEATIEHAGECIE